MEAVKFSSFYRYPAILIRGLPFHGLSKNALEIEPYQKEKQSTCSCETKLTVLQIFHGGNNVLPLRGS